MKRRETNEELVARFQAGDKSALATLVCQNESLVYRVVKKYIAGNDLDDAAQVGRIAVMRAAKHFDPGYNCKFITYAWWSISRSVMRWVKVQRRDPCSCDRGVEWDQASLLGLLQGRSERPEEIAMTREYREALRADVVWRLAALTDRERRIVVARTEGRTLADIGDEFGISKERTRQIYMQALRSMRFAPGLPSMRKA